VRRVREAGAGVTTGRGRQWARRQAFVLALFSTVVLYGGSAPAAQTRRPTGRPPAPASARHAPLKAIFEPVSFPQDVDISDIFFVDPEVGWACGHRLTDGGDGGFIIATRDGGRTWSVQFGNPRSPTRAFTRLYFFDATHGWATQVDGTLRRTTDGTRWTSIGTVAPASSMAFVSPERGFFLDRAQGVYRTVDGGRTWRLGNAGAPVAIAFAPDNLTGYVLTRTPDERAAAVLKTTDAGETWTLRCLVRDISVTDVSMAFSDTSTGYLRAGASLKMTTDGGRTWQALTAKVPYDVSNIVVAGSIGWMIGSHEFSYTLDGGKRWTVRQVDFPAHVVTFTVLGPETGYVAGRHGMIYRYRIVAFDYTVPSMLTIPGMTTFAPAGS
jgi:photosystem II stability/assembly factor-like uncharacterized protein